MEIKTIKNNCSFKILFFVEFIFRNESNKFFCFWNQLLDKAFSKPKRVALSSFFEMKVINFLFLESAIKKGFQQTKKSGL